jgi:nucleoside-diphosphate-sugar epimerase
VIEIGMTPPSVLVLGANGRFGAVAVQAFAAAGWQVFAQLRRAPTTPLPAGARALQVPLHDTAGLLHAAAGARVVVHALNPIYSRWQADLLPMARQGMAIAEALGARFMLPGNVYNFGADMPALLQEDTPQQPSTRKGALRCALEAELLLRCGPRGRSSRLQATVIRAGDFFGAGRGSWMDLVIAKALPRGKLVYPGPLDVPHAWAYLPDLSSAFVAAATRNQASDFETLHFAGHNFTGQQLLDGIETAATQLGQCPAGGCRRAGFPWRVIALGGLVWPAWRGLSEMRYLWQVPHALDGQALQRALGVPRHTPTAEALRSTLLNLGPQPAPSLSTATSTIQSRP